MSERNRRIAVEIVASDLRMSARYSEEASVSCGQLGPAAESLAMATLALLRAVESGSEADPSAALIALGGAQRELEAVDRALSGAAHHLGRVPARVAPERAEEP